MNSTASASRSTILMLAFILCLSFAIKFGLRVYLSQGINFWEGGYSFYHQMALNFLKTGELYLQNSHSLYDAPKLYAIRTPLYPLLIAFVSQWAQHSVTALVLVQSVISTATVFLVYLTALEVPLKPAGALAGAALCAFYPYALFHDTQLQENVLYNFFSIFSVWALLCGVGRKKGSFFFLSGIALGAAALTRASHLIHAIALIGFILYSQRGERKKALRFIALTLTGLFLILAPWSIRNQRVLGAPVLTSLTGGALSEAHNPYTFHYYPYRGSIDQSTALFRIELARNEKTTLDALGSDEMAQNKWYRKLALNYMAGHKMETVRRGLVKIAVNFLGVLSPLRTPPKNWSYFLSYWALTLLMIRGLPAIAKTPFFKMFLVLCGSQALFSFVFWAHTSHRAFLDPMLAVAAGAGCFLFARADR